AFLAGADEVDKIFESLAAQPVMVDALWKHSRKEECEISDVLADLSLPVERGSWAINGIRFEQHLANVCERSSGSVLQLEQLLGIAEVAQHLGNVSADLRIIDADRTGKLLAHQRGKKLQQQVVFRLTIFRAHLHSSLPVVRMRTPLMPG